MQPKCDLFCRKKKICAEICFRAFFFAQIFVWNMKQQNPNAKDNRTEDVRRRKEIKRTHIHTVLKIKK